MLKEISISFRRAVALAALASLCLSGVACGKSDKCDDDSVLKAYMEDCAGAGGDSGSGGTSGTAGTGGTTSTAGNSGTSVGGGTSSGDDAVVFEWGQSGKEPAIQSGEWQVDNNHGGWEGEKALHPPALPGKDSATLALNCGAAAHTLLSFRVHRTVGDAELELFDGDVTRGVLSVGYEWSEQIFVVPPGPHEYTLVARNLGTTEVKPAFVVDAIVCKYFEPADAGVVGEFANKVVDFDDGFIPTELGGWLVDNLRGTHKGDAALHPPALRGKDTSQMTFECGTEHTQLSFLVHRTVGDVELELFDGKISRGKVAAGYEWSQQIINVPAGEHQYRLVARNLGTTDVPEPFVIDTFTCEKRDPSPGHNGIVTLDDGFIPPELEGWFVDNMRGAHQGQAAIHPPELSPQSEASLTVNCGAEASGLEFIVHRTTGGAELELIDGTGSSRVLEVGYEWSEKKFDGEGSTYQLIARNAGTTPITEPFVLDTFICK